MQWLTILFLGIAANLDNLGFGLAYGIQKVRIPILSNAVIAILSMMVTALAMVAAEGLAYIMPEQIANRLGGFMLCLIGVWMLIQELKPNQALCKNNLHADKDGNRILSVREVLPPGFLLSANSLAGGFGMGVSGGPMTATVLSIGVFSFLTIHCGNRFGGALTRFYLGRHPGVLAGGLLIVIGIVEMAI
ncbi:putative sporulation protein YtaF [Bhargavaea ginsengi]|uniref:Putative sporulation protein YtaF n=1 Tax=Bhargavaea ginsengi TaxID=426757 RepID=A0A1H7AWF1_9BACL|nr:manganese efflux pump [Bhargavaea ginsengi]SEJ69931.1 putative sporulation protein YtaF [Bhargavaea ginsengi]